MLHTTHTTLDQLLQKASQVPHTLWDERRTATSNHRVEVPSCCLRSFPLEAVKQ